MTGLGIMLHLTAIDQSRSKFLSSYESVFLRMKCYFKILYSEIFLLYLQELRRRYNSTILIQAFVRGYLTRQRHKKMQRMAFDETVQHGSYVCQTPDEQTLTLLIQRLLFFYSEEEDASRLVGS